MNHLASIAISLAACAVATSACADPDAYVHVPTVEYGEREIDFKIGNAHGGPDGSVSAASLGFGYGATPWWFTEIYAKALRESGDTTRFDAFEWENKFQLTEPGEHFVDLGFLVEIERPRNRAEGWEVKLGPLLQKDLGPVQANVNVFLARHYRSEEPQVTELSYEWQLRYRWKPQLDFGLQGFGEVGKWDHWAPGSEQRHIVGPAIFGKFLLGGRQALVYNAAFLFKASDAAPTRTLRAQVEYEF